MVSNGKRICALVPITWSCMLDCSLDFNPARRSTSDNTRFYHKYYRSLGTCPIAPLSGHISSLAIAYRLYSETILRSTDNNSDPFWFLIQDVESNNCVCI